MEAILDDHETTRNVAQTIPCVHEDLIPDLPLLGEAFKKFGGALFDLSASEGDWTAPAAPVNAHRETMVRAILDNFTDTLPKRVEFDVSAGEVSAQIVGEDVSVAETSLAVVLRLVALLVSNSLDEYDLIAICTSAVEAEPRRRELIWQLLTVSAQDVVSGPKTIVPILGRRVEVEIDFARTPEVRYVVRADRLLRRSALHLSQAIRSICDGTGPIVLFLGAGASASSKMQLGDAYRTIALEGLLGTPSLDGGEDLIEPFFEYLAAEGRFLGNERTDRASYFESLTLERVLRETFHALGYASRGSTAVMQEFLVDEERSLQQTGVPGRLSMGELSRTLRNRLVLITVNFDHIIENSIEGPFNAIYTAEQFKESIGGVRRYLEGDRSEPIPVLKLHGSLEDLDSLVATIDSTMSGLPAEVIDMLDMIRDFEADEPTTWVWVGCSMRDRDVNKWLHGLKREALNEWWVDPFPSAHLDKFHHEHRQAWAERDLSLKSRLLIEGADGFLGALARHASGS